MRFTYLLNLTQPITMALKNATHNAESRAIHFAFLTITFVSEIEIAFNVSLNAMTFLMEPTCYILDKPEKQDKYRGNLTIQ